MTAVRQVTWGDALVVEVFHTVGGLKAATDAIEQLVPTAGSRMTFGKLLAVDDPATLSPKYRWRAWLLLTALHQEPAEWGITDDVVPAFMDADGLKAKLRGLVRREGLEPPTRWLRASRRSRRHAMSCDYSTLGRVA